MATEHGGEVEMDMIAEERAIRGTVHLASALVT
jgi:hypothetical protein